MGQSWENWHEIEHESIDNYIKQDAQQPITGSSERTNSQDTVESVAALGAVASQTANSSLDTKS